MDALPEILTMSRSCVALCEGCGATAKLFEDTERQTWQLGPPELAAFLARHRECGARLGDRPCVTLEIVNG